jgi:hypothetical protein
MGLRSAIGGECPLRRSSSTSRRLRSGTGSGLRDVEPRRIGCGPRGPARRSVNVQYRQPRLADAVIFSVHSQTSAINFASRERGLDLAGLLARNCKPGWASIAIRTRSVGCSARADSQGAFTSMGAPTWATYGCRSPSMERPEENIDIERRKRN